MLKHVLKNSGFGAGFAQRNGKSFHAGQVASLATSFFGVEDVVDDNNSCPYTYKEEKMSKNPTRHISFRQRTGAYMEPFTLDLFISKRFVSASLTHRMTSKQVAVSGTNSKDIKAALRSKSDIPACLSVGRFLAERARVADVQSLIDDGFDAKIYLD